MEEVGTIEASCGDGAVGVFSVGLIGAGVGLGFVMDCGNGGARSQLFSSEMRLCPMAGGAGHC